MDSQPVRTVFRPEGTGKSVDSGDVGFGLTYARSFTDKFSAGISGNYLQSTLASAYGSSLMKKKGDKSAQETSHLHREPRKCPTLTPVCHDRVSACCPPATSTIGTSFRG